MEKIWTEQLVKIYRRRRVVDEVNIEINRGEVVGLLGSNGAGKTTTFYMITGLIRPDKGKVFFRGKDITHIPMFQRSRMGLGYLAQEPSIFRKLTVEENILLILEALGIERTEREKRCSRMLQELEIKHLADYKGYMLSGGERRRVEIARTLASSPSFILLDEPFTGIDPIAVYDIQEIIGYLKEKGLGILITDHNVRETMKITDRTYIMHDGKILASGNPSEVASSEITRKYYLGERFTL
ncbi:MAG: LPS export ABC transporter ATP-binding protein [Atribacterota bacterium]|nr:LPS export ABC transporter ATP-binding protein [Atribacterota bacterium]MDD4895489.1 LPS export ABC transporter ATP-binding protein [Atribacterota bacterium]MDD5637858.1 LPS export ABC transporter ATP-binding protein [Atribacterota bacterium]